MKDVLATLATWQRDGRRAAAGIVVERRGSAPRDPGALIALSDRGELAGSVTGGCVEPAVIAEAQEVLDGAPPRIAVYGVSDADAFDVGLACGGTVAIAILPLDLALAARIGEATGADQPVALALPLGAALGEQRLVCDDEPADALAAAARTLLQAGETAIVEVDGEPVFVAAFPPRPAMYVFGAVDHAGALARAGRFLGYRVTICDARARFVTRERFPDADELVVDWPDRFLRAAPVDARTAICVLTHDPKFDVPALVSALRSPAGYVGAMGSRTTTAEREVRLREEGLAGEDLARLHAPIGLPIGARSPEEVAIAVAAEIVESVAETRRRARAGLAAGASVIGPQAG